MPKKAQHGTKLFCQQLGFRTGFWTGDKKVLSTKSVCIGKCKQGDQWPNCTGADAVVDEHKLNVGGKCGDDHDGTCNEGEKVGLKIKCTGRFDMYSVNSSKYL